MKSHPNPDRKDVRNFGLTFGVILTLVSGLLYYKGKPYYVYPLSIAVFFVFSGLFFTSLLNPLFRGWMRFAKALAWFNTQVILVLMFYLVVTPIGLVMRLVGKDPLQRKMEPDRDSYWEDKSLPKDPDQYKKQF